MELVLIPFIRGEGFAIAKNFRPQRMKGLHSPSLDLTFRIADVFSFMVTIQSYKNNACFYFTVYEFIKRRRLK